MAVICPQVHMLFNPARAQNVSSCSYVGKNNFYDEANITHVSGTCQIGFEYDIGLSLRYNILNEYQIISLIMVSFCYLTYSEQNIRNDVHHGVLLSRSPAFSWVGHQMSLF